MTLWSMADQDAVNPALKGTKASAHYQDEYWSRSELSDQAEAD